MFFQDESSMGGGGLSDDDQGSDLGGSPFETGDQSEKTEDDQPAGGGLDDLNMGGPAAEEEGDEKEGDEKEEEGSGEEGEDPMAL